MYLLGNSVLIKEKTGVDYCGLIRDGRFLSAKKSAEKIEKNEKTEKKLEYGILAI